VDKSRANILQIQKYLNGELDAKAMHRLEREALDDPFLMDALEGYQAAAGNQQPNLDLLAEQINARVSKKERRIIPWTTISIAAGIVGFMIVVGLLYKNNSPATPQKTAEVIEQPISGADTVNPAAVIPEKKADIAVLPTNRNAVISPRLKESAKSFQYDKNDDMPNGSIAEAELAPVPNTGVEIAPAAAATPLDEMIMGTLSKQKDSAEMPLVVALKKRPILQPLTGKAEGVNSEAKRPASQFELNKLDLPPGYLSAAANNSSNTAPVPASIYKANAKPPVLTDSKGQYAAPAASPSPLAEPVLSGFDVKTSASNSSVSNKPLLNTNLTADSVAGYFSRANSLNTATLAQPQKGWVMYQLYLSQKCTLPVGQKPGAVELKFTISPTGQINNVTVLKGLSPEANKKAVRLITDGPKWIGNANGKPEEKTLRLEFINK
jgi:hypothetical protein